MATDKRIFTAFLTCVDSLRGVYDDETRYKFLYNYGLILDKMTLGDAPAISRHVNALKEYLNFNKPLLISRKLEDAIPPYDKMVYRADTDGRPKIYLDLIMLIREAPSNEIRSTIYRHLYHLSCLCFPDWELPTISREAMLGQTERTVPEGAATTVEEAKIKVKNVLSTVKAQLSGVDKSRGLMGLFELFTGDAGSNIIKQFEEITSSNLDGKQTIAAALQALQEEMKDGNLDLSKMFSALSGGKEKAADSRLSQEEIIELADRLKRVDTHYEQQAIEGAPQIEEIPSIEKKKKKKVLAIEQKPEKNLRKSKVVIQDEEL